LKSTIGKHKIFKFSTFLLEKIHDCVNDIGAPRFRVNSKTHCAAVFFYANVTQRIKISRRACHISRHARFTFLLFSDYGHVQTRPFHAENHYA